MKLIAVVTDNIPATFRWLKEEYNIVRILAGSREAHKEDGTRFVLISNREQALSWEFSDVIVYPLYESLEMVCRRRIR